MTPDFDAPRSRKVSRDFYLVPEAGKGPVVCRRMGIQRHGMLGEINGPILRGLSLHHA